MHPMVWNRSMVSTQGRKAPFCWWVILMFFLILNELWNRFKIVVSVYLFAFSFGDPFFLKNANLKIEKI